MMSYLVYLTLFTFCFGTKYDIDVDIISIDEVKRRIMYETPYPNELKVNLGESEISEPLILNLQKNVALFSKNYKEGYLAKDGKYHEMKDHSGIHTRNCHYVGKVEGHSRGLVSMSTCGDKHTAWIQTDDKQLVLEKENGEFKIRHFADALPKNVKDNYFIDAEQPGKKFQGAASTLLKQNGKGRRNTLSIDHSGRTKYVEVLVVNDVSRVESFNHDFDALVDQTTTLMNMVAVFYTQDQDKGKFEFKIVILLTGVFAFTIDNDPYEHVNMQGVETNANHLLEKFSNWQFQVTDSGMLPPHDNAVLLSGRDFVGNTIGLAYIGTMCLPSRSSSINECRANTDITSCAAVVAHEMGHNFGMNHDVGQDQDCPRSGFIMNSLLSHATQNIFSECSVNYVNEWFQTLYRARGFCLEAEHSFTTVGDPHCGNGFVEEGEDCDCGKDDCGQNSCCDGNTCTFKQSSFVCDSEIGPCCKNCHYIAAKENHVCRPDASDCDEPEMCNGKSADCPVDIYAYPGTPCKGKSGAEGTCYARECHTLEEQCTGLYYGNPMLQIGYNDICGDYNNDCMYPVCHNSQKKDDAWECNSYFKLEESIVHIADGMECWHPSMPYDYKSSNYKRGICMNLKCNLPHVAAITGHCGNGGVDFGEECDCGQNPGDHPHCNCNTCKFKPGKQCDSALPCCTSSGQIQSAGVTCRPSADECDIAEVCDGVSARCPVDMGEPFTTECTYKDGNKSTCYGRRCLPSLDDFCKEKYNNKNAKFFTFNDDAHSCNKIICCRNGNSGCMLSSYTMSFGPHASKMGGFPRGAKLPKDDASSLTRCIDQEEKKLVTRASRCSRGLYHDISVGDCIYCDISCVDGCTGPTQYDCTRCNFGSPDRNGACPISKEQFDAFVNSVNEETAAAPIFDCLGVPNGQAVEDICGVCNGNGNSCACEKGNHNCDKNAECANSTSGPQCTCKSGFVGNGLSCQKLVNECLIGTDNCDKNARCNDTPLSFTCTCNKGFSGNGKSCTRDAVNECASAHLNNCDENAKCVDTDTSFDCICKDGFEGNGRSCRDINECLNNPCGENENCQNTFGSFACMCKDGFNPRQDGSGCDRIPACLHPDTNNCSRKATCSDGSNGQFQCTCDAGHVGDGTEGNCRMRCSTGASICRDGFVAKANAESILCPGEECHVSDRDLCCDKAMSDTLSFEYFKGNANTNVGTTCHRSQRVALKCFKSKPCDLQKCQDYCADDKRCNYFFYNINSACTLYGECQKLRRVGIHGVTKKKVEAGSVDVKGEIKPRYEYILGNDHSNVRQTCRGKNKLVCGKKNGCDLETCKTHCAESNTCQYIFYTTKNFCFLYDVCNLKPRKFRRQPGVIMKKVSGTETQVSSTDFTIMYKPLYSKETYAFIAFCAGIFAIFIYRLKKQINEANNDDFGSLLIEEL